MKNNRTPGFTLIELLIVVVIIGVLAAIAIPKFATIKEKVYVAAMKSDLRNLANFEESYAADSSGMYFTGTSVTPATMQGFVSSPNVTVTATSAAGPPPAWTGSTTHALTTRVCSFSSTGLITCT